MARMHNPPHPGEIIEELWLATFRRKNPGPNRLIWKCVGAPESARDGRFVRGRRGPTEVCSARPDRPPDRVGVFSEKKR